MVFVGIDPGLEGAIAEISEAGIIVTDVPQVGGDYDLNELMALFEAFRRDMEQSGNRWLAMIEWPQSHPGNSAASNVKIGEGRGIMRACLVRAGIGYQRVTPGKWKQHFGLKASSNETPSIVKEKSRAKAMELFPTAELHLKKHHNRAEALLIAEYLRRTHQPAKELVS